MNDDKAKGSREDTSSSASMDGECIEITEELVLDIQSRTFENDHNDISSVNGSLATSPVSKRFRFSPMPSPRIGSRCMSPSSSKKNSKNRNKNDADIEEGVGLVFGGRDKSYIPRTWSLTNLFAPRKSKKNGSLPITPLVHSNPESMHGKYAVDSATSMKTELVLPIRRSRSVPMLINKDGSVKSSRILRVIPTPSRGDLGMMQSKLNDENDGEDLPEEEAVCRICMCELDEDSEAFKLECMCKGELALAHRTCAIKWFSIKRSTTCEVCKGEVKNLPVTLFRLQQEAALDRSRTAGNIDQSRRFSDCQDVPVLVIVSMLAYFCSLEQLLVIDLNTSAIAIALPFSCIIGLLGSMTSATMVKKNYMWLFATVQFLFVVLFAHVFYVIVKQPVMSIVLATLIGFGLAMSGSSAINEYLKRRRRPTTIRVP